MDQWFEHLNEQVQLAPDGAAIQDALKRLTKEAEFDAYAYLGLQGALPTAISDYPSDWQKRYLERGYSAIDPVVRTARSKMSCFCWSLTAFHTLPKEIRGFCAEASEVGIRSGLSVPIRTGFGCMAILTLASRGPSNAQDRRVNPILAAAAVGQVHARLSFVSERAIGQTRVKLRASEATCLRWSAEGKSMRDIAVIEKTSYSNICFFVRSAKAALQVTTLAQATARATALGLI